MGVRFEEHRGRSGCSPTTDPTARDLESGGAHTRAATVIAGGNSSTFRHRRSRLRLAR
jgi:hypothetical protein